MPHKIIYYNNDSDTNIDINIDIDTDTDKDHDYKEEEEEEEEEEEGKEKVESCFILSIDNFSHKINHYNNNTKIGSNTNTNTNIDTNNNDCLVINCDWNIMEKKNVWKISDEKFENNCRHINSSPVNSI